jgi:hypothetical protein
MNKTALRALIVAALSAAVLSVGGGVALASPASTDPSCPAGEEFQGEFGCVATELPGETQGLQIDCPDGQVGTQQGDQVICPPAKAVTPASQVPTSGSSATPGKAPTSSTVSKAPVAKKTPAPQTFQEPLADGAVAGVNQPTVPAVPSFSSAQIAAVLAAWLGQLRLL